MAGNGDAQWAWLVAPHPRLSDSLCATVGLRTRLSTMQWRRVGIDSLSSNILLLYPRYIVLFSWLTSISIRDSGSYSAAFGSCCTWPISVHKVLSSSCAPNLSGPCPSARLHAKQPCISPSPHSSPPKSCKTAVPHTRRTQVLITVDCRREGMLRHGMRRFPAPQRQLARRVS